MPTTLAARPKKEKLVLLVRLRAAMAVNDDEYAAAIEDFRSTRTTPAST